MQEFVNLLSKVIFYTIVATIVMSVVTYAAYRIRNARGKPRVGSPPLIPTEGGVFLEPVLFEKYVPEEDER